MDPVWMTLWELVSEFGWGAYAAVVAFLALVIGYLKNATDLWEKLGPVARWLKPLRIAPGYEFRFDSEKRGAIFATITNQSGKPCYITRCVARSTYHPLFVLIRYMRRPRIRRGYWDALAFTFPTFDLLSSAAALRLDPDEPRRLVCALPDISSHPLAQLAQFFAPMFLIEVHLSTHRIVRSGRIVVPERWRFKPKPPRDSKTAQPSAAQGT